MSHFCLRPGKGSRLRDISVGTLRRRSQPNRWCSTGDPTVETACEVQT